MIKHITAKLAQQNYRFNTKNFDDELNVTKNPLKSNKSDKSPNVKEKTNDFIEVIKTSPMTQNLSTACPKPLSNFKKSGSNKLNLMNGETKNCIGINNSTENKFADENINSNTAANKNEPGGDSNKKRKLGLQVESKFMWRTYVQPYKVKDIEESSDSGLYDMGASSMNEISKIYGSNGGDIIKTKKPIISNTTIQKPKPWLTKSDAKTLDFSISFGNDNYQKNEGPEEILAANSNFINNHQKSCNSWQKGHFTESNLYESVYCKTFPTSEYFHDDLDTDNISRFIDQNYNFDIQEEQSESIKSIPITNKIESYLSESQENQKSNRRLSVIGNIQEIEAHINLEEETINTAVSSIRLSEGHTGQNDRETENVRSNTFKTRRDSILYHTSLPSVTALPSPFYDSTLPFKVKEFTDRSSGNANETNSIYESIRSSSRASSSICSKCRCKMNDVAKDSKIESRDYNSHHRQHRYTKRHTSDKQSHCNSSLENREYEKPKALRAQRNVEESRYWHNSSHSEQTSLYFTLEEAIAEDTSRFLPYLMKASTLTKEVAKPSKDFQRKRRLSQHLSYSTSVIDSIQFMDNDNGNKRNPYRPISPASLTGIENSKFDVIQTDNTQTLPWGYENRKQQYESNWSLMRPPKQFNVRFEDLDPITNKWSGYIPEANYDILLKPRHGYPSKRANNPLFRGLKKGAYLLIKHFKKR